MRAYWYILASIALSGTAWGLAFTDLTTGGVDYQAASVHNELWNALIQRQNIINDGTTNATINAGDDIQSNGYYNVFQDWLLAHYGKFVDTNSTLTGVTGSSDPSDMWASNTYYLAAQITNGFRRATSYDPDVNTWTDYDDPMYSYGSCQDGDIVGPWLLVDIQNAFKPLIWTKIFIDVPANASSGQTEGPGSIGDDTTYATNWGVSGGAEGSYNAIYSTRSNNWANVDYQNTTPSSFYHANKAVSYLGTWGGGYDRTVAHPSATVYNGEGVTVNYELYYYCISCTNSQDSNGWDPDGYGVDGSSHTNWVGPILSGSDTDASIVAEQLGEDSSAMFPWLETPAWTYGNPVTNQSYKVWFVDQLWIFKWDIYGSD